MPLCLREILCDSSSWPASLLSARHRLSRRRRGTEKHRPSTLTRVLPSCSTEKRHGKLLSGYVTEGDGVHPDSSWLPNYPAAGHLRHSSSAQIPTQWPGSSSRFSKPMLRFKKRLRILAEQLSSSVRHRPHDAITVRTDSGTATFTSQSYDTMTCSIDLGDGSRTFPLPKRYVFDIVDRLGNEHLAETLRDYPRPPLLTLNDYINDEHGLSELVSLQRQITKNPSLDRKALGGNRILADYVRGVLVLRDDLIMAGTHVIEFSASTPSLSRQGTTNC